MATAAEYIPAEVQRIEAANNRIAALSALQRAQLGPLVAATVSQASSPGNAEFTQKLEQVEHQLAFATFGVIPP